MFKFFFSKFFPAPEKPDFESIDMFLFLIKPFFISGTKGI